MSKPSERKRRKKRKREEAQARANRMAHPRSAGSRVLTVTQYGRNGQVEMIGAVVHRGKEVFASQLFRSLEFSTEKDMAGAICAFGQKHQMAQCHHVAEVLPPEDAFYDGEYVPRISDLPLS